jgi:hypothetical protein
MKYVVVFLFFICLILWFERFYWRRRAELLELRVLGKDRTKELKNWFDAWLDRRIEARLRKQRGRI